MKKCTTEEFKQKASAIHHNKYKYSKTKYINENVSVIIECPMHGEFSQIPSLHLAGLGCGVCKNIAISTSNLTSINKLIQKAVIGHGAKYNYSRL